MPQSTKFDLKFTRFVPKNLSENHNCASANTKDIRQDDAHLFGAHKPAKPTVSTLLPTSKMTEQTLPTFLPDTSMLTLEGLRNSSAIIQTVDSLELDYDDIDA